MLILPYGAGTGGDQLMDGGSQMDTGEVETSGGQAGRAVPAQEEVLSGLELDLS